MKKRSLIETEDEWRASAGGRLVAQLELLAGVAVKALEHGKTAEAERLLSTPVAEFMDFAARASSVEDWEHVARLHGAFLKILPRLEAATGKPWTRCLDAVKQRVSRPFVPPRGQA